MIDTPEAVVEEKHQRRRGDRYARPEDDHDLLTQLWTMFIHSCDESTVRHSENRRTIEDMRREIAENRSAGNYRIETLAKDIETRFGVMQRDIDTLKTTNAKQIGAVELLKIVIPIVIAAGATGAAVSMFIVRLATGH